MRLVLFLCALVLGACPSPPEPPEPRHHPDGYADPQVHGPDLLLQTADCLTCHGPELTGSPDAGVGFLTDVGCDDCHQAGWREDCTYCHGGDENDTGAPPDGIGGSGVDFPHAAHVDSAVHAARACSLCHVEPDDVLSAGHVFDGSAGTAEVDLSGGTAPDVVWSGTGCSNNACHGDGLNPGAVELPDAPLGCEGCHPGPGSDPDDFITMSGDHRDHERYGITCSECHPNVDANDRVIDRDTHVNFSVEVEMPEGMGIEFGHCTGTCHDEVHAEPPW